MRVWGVCGEHGVCVCVEPFQAPQSPLLQSGG